MTSKHKDCINEAEKQPRTKYLISFKVSEIMKMGYSVAQSGRTPSEGETEVGGGQNCSPVLAPPTTGGCPAPDPLLSRFKLWIRTSTPSFSHLLQIWLTYI